MGAIWLNNIRPGGVLMFCMQPLLVVCCVFLTFRLMNLRLFLALFVIMCMWDDQLRSLLIVTPRYFAFFCGSEGGVMMCVWEDNWFLFSMYSENFTLVRVKFH